MNPYFMSKSKMCSVVLFLSVLSTHFLVQADVLSNKRALAISPGDPHLEWTACPDFLPCTFAVLQGELGGNNLDIFLKFPAKAIVPFHTHTSAEHMIMLSGEFHTTYKGQEKVVLKTRDYAYGPANLPHDGYCASAEECVLFVAYETPIDATPHQTEKLPSDV